MRVDSATIGKSSNKGRNDGYKVQKPDQKVKNKVASAEYRKRKGQGEAYQAERYLVCKAVHTRLWSDWQTILRQINDTRRFMELHMRHGSCTCQDLRTLQRFRDEAFMAGIREEFHLQQLDREGVIQRAIRRVDLSKIREAIQDKSQKNPTQQELTPEQTISEGSTQSVELPVLISTAKPVPDRKVENKEAVRKSRANDRAEKELRDAMIEAFVEVNQILAKGCADTLREEHNLSELLARPRTCEAEMMDRPRAICKDMSALTVEDIFQSSKYLLDDTIEKTIRHKGPFDNPAAQLSIVKAAQAEYDEFLEHNAVDMAEPLNDLEQDLQYNDLPQPCTLPGNTSQQASPQEMFLPPNDLQQNDVQQWLSNATFSSKGSQETPWRQHNLPEYDLPEENAQRCELQQSNSLENGMQQNMIQGFPQLSNMHQGFPQLGGSIHQGFLQQANIHQGFHQQANIHQGFPQLNNVDQGVPQQNNFHQVFSQQDNMHQGFAQQNNMYQVFPQQINMQECNLQQINTQECNLQQNNMQECNLQQNNTQECNLQQNNIQDFGMQLDSTHDYGLQQPNGTYEHGLHQLGLQAEYIQDDMQLAPAQTVPDGMLDFGTGLMPPEDEEYLQTGNFQLCLDGAGFE